MKPKGEGRRDALPTGTVLDQYVMEEVLGGGGFGIVYRARHRVIGGAVAIKEFLPLELAVRDRDGVSVHPRMGDSRDRYESEMARFEGEAKELERFQTHPGVVSVRGFFPANGTAYLVMNYEDGEPLSEFLKRREEGWECERRRFHLHRVRSSAKRWNRTKVTMKGWC